MTRSFLSELARAVDSEAPREERAGIAAAMIREDGGYRRVRIYDVGDDYIVLIAHAGSPDPTERRFAVGTGASGEAVSTRATVRRKDEIVVPILGAESGVVIGTLAADGGTRSPSPDAVAYVEDCAAVLRPLYD